MNWLILAIAPGVAISSYIIFKDEYNKEPRKHLLISFILGVISIVPAMVLELPLVWTDHLTFFSSSFGNAIKAFLIVALPEELAKFFMLKFYAYRQPEYDEPFYLILLGMRIEFFGIHSVVFAQLFTVWYFFHFVALLPLLSKIERAKGLPKSISEPVLRPAGA